MKTNIDARIWCSENYDSAKETYYVQNAKKLIFEEWRTSWKHALVSLAVVLIGMTIGLIESPLLWLAAMQVGFAFYGILSYMYNDQGAGGLAYISSLIFFINVLKDGNPALKVLFILIGLALLGASAVTELNYRKVADKQQEPAQKQWETDEEEFEAWKKKYYTGYARETNTTEEKTNNSNYSGDYKQKTYTEEKSSYTTAEKTVNKYAQQAQALFADFGSTCADLKKRYRKLAMHHHPDRGGEHDMFVAIVAEYEYLKSTRFPGEK